MNFEKKKNNRFNSLMDEVNTEKDPSDRSESRDRSERTRDRYGHSDRNRRYDRQNRNRRYDRNNGKNYFNKKYNDYKKKEKKIIMPEINDKNLFPSLEENVEENKRQSIFLDDDEIEKSKSKSDWKSIIKNQKPDIKKDSPDYIKPGWVKIEYDKIQGKFVYTYGDKVPLLPLLVEWKKQKAIQKRNEFIKRMEELEEYDYYMHEYEIVPGYEDYENYESSDDEFIEIGEEEFSDEEYYEDDY
jgi:hypothetical protein